jgi:hypothetical protein
LWHTHVYQQQSQGLLSGFTAIALQQGISNIRRFPSVSQLSSDVTGDEITARMRYKN